MRPTSIMRADGPPMLYRQWDSRAPTGRFASHAARLPRPLPRGGRRAACRLSVGDAPLDCPLLILESETGSGKTEAAIWRFAKLWKAVAGDQSSMAFRC